MCFCVLAHVRANQQCQITITCNQYSFITYLKTILDMPPTTFALFSRYSIGRMSGDSYMCGNQQQCV